MFKLLQVLYFQNCNATPGSCLFPQPSTIKEFKRLTCWNLLLKFFFEELQVALLLFLLSGFLQRLKHRCGNIMSRLKESMINQKRGSCWRRQYLRVSCLMLKTEVGFPKARSFLFGFRSATWVCTTFLSFHRQLPPLKEKKNVFDYITISIF